MSIFKRIPTFKRLGTTMSKVLNDLPASARNSITRVLRVLASSNNSQIAEQLGLDPSSFSRMKNDKKSNGLTDIENVCAMLDSLGLKLVPKKYKMISETRLAALLEMAKSWMDRIDSVDDLFQDEIDELGIGQELGYKEKA